jgi:CTP:molybdopterin cytidylyltransferase MocA
MMDAQAYLLAAGEGRRAGGPKAWAMHQGKTLLERQLQFLQGLLQPADLAVSVQAAWLERCRKLAPEVRWTAVEPSARPLGALQALLGSMPSRGWAFVYHVDMPVWEPELFEILLRRALESRDADAVAPEKGGRKGHPVLLSKSACHAVRLLDGAKDRLDVFLRSRREATVSVPFASIHENWNAGVPA